MACAVIYKIFIEASELLGNYILPLQLMWSKSIYISCDLWFNIWIFTHPIKDIVFLKYIFYPKNFLPGSILKLSNNFRTAKYFIKQRRLTYISAISLNDFDTFSFFYRFCLLLVTVPLCNSIFQYKNEPSAINAWFNKTHVLRIV
jgi:hypothetical protein